MWFDVNPMWKLERSCNSRAHVRTGSDHVKEIKIKITALVSFILNKIVKKSKTAKILKFTFHPYHLQEF